MFVASSAVANPVDGNVVAGSAEFEQISGTQLNVKQTTDKAIIDWRSFSIAPNEHTSFEQLSTSSIALNRVTGNIPSEILGKLTGNGQIMLINPNGILFGQGAQVDVAGLVATTADISNKDFMAGNYNFDIAGNPQASIINQGTITIKDQGLLAFVAPGVVNNGVINAHLGRVTLAAGNRFTLDLYGDQLVELAVEDEVVTKILGVDGEELDSLIENSGEISADGGTIVLTAQAARHVVDNVINMSGVLRARSAGVENGEIVLYGGNAGNVNISGKLDVSGETQGGRIDIKGEQIQTTKDVVLNAGATGTGDGGNIVAYANDVGYYDGSFSAKGGEKGGNGGFIETSGKRVKIADGISINTSATEGETGLWSIDPNTLDVIAGNSSSSNGNQSTIGADTVVNALQTTSVNLQARKTININAVVDSSAQTNSNTLSLTDQNNNNDLTVNLKADINLGSNQNLTGEAATVNVADTAEIQDGVDVAAENADVNVAAGEYHESLKINKALTLKGTSGAKIVVSDNGGGSSINGININADNVTVRNLEIVGPVDASYLTYNWGSKISRGIAVASGSTNFTIENNNIHDVRNGILIDGRNNTGSVTNNIIENTKSGISVQYTDASGISISGNSEGTFGNEWGLNLHLNRFLDNGTLHPNPYLSEPSLAWQQALLDFSNNNSGWTVQDQGYSSSNRTHVQVATTGSSGNQGSLLTPLDSISSGIDAVVRGGVVNVNDGAYAQSSTLNINKSITLNGAGRDNVIIDARSVGNQYGISVSANDVSLNNFTLYGSNSDTASAYGIKVSPGGTPDARLTNFSINNVLSRGAGRAELDLNGVNGASINNFIADGAPVGNDNGTTNGAGIQLTDTSNVTVDNTTTHNNAWGGVALYQANRHYDQQTGNITIADNNNFTEFNPLYAQDESSTNNFGTLTLNGYEYIVRNNTFRSDADGFTFFQRNESDAIDFALALSTQDDSVVRKNNSATYNDKLDADGNFIVGTNGTDVMSIQTAINNAAAGNTINVNAGNYARFGTSFGGPANLSIIGSDGAQISLDGSGSLKRIVDLRADGTIFSGFSIDGGGTHVGISVSGQGVTVSDNTIDNVLTGIQTTTQYVEGGNTITGNEITNSGYGISLQNNSNTITNNIIDVETEGLGIGSSGNTISNNDLSIGTNGKHLKTYTRADYSALPGADIDLLQVVADNEFDRATYITNGSNVAVQTIFGSVQSAINEATDGVGDTVNIEAGNYNENITLNKSLNLNSNNATLLSLNSVAGTTTGLSGQLIANSIDMVGDIRLSGTTTTINTSANNGNIAFTGEIDGTVVKQQNLNLNAGKGAVKLNNVGQSISLGDLTITSSDYDASSGTTDVVNLTVNGDDISVGNNTVNASGNVALIGNNVFGSINASSVNISSANNVNAKINSTSKVNVSAKNITGQISAKQANISATNVSGVISAQNLAVSATNVSGVISAQNLAVSATNVSGQITAQKASITATNSLNVNVNINNLTVSSGGKATITGSVNNINVASGSKSVSVNSRTVTQLSNSGQDSNNTVLNPDLNTPIPMLVTTVTPGEIAFGNGVTDVFSTNFSLGLSIAELTDMPLRTDTSEGSEGNEEVDRFLFDFWGYYLNQ